MFKKNVYCLGPPFKAKPSRLGPLPSHTKDETREQSKPPQRYTGLSPEPHTLTCAPPEMSHFPLSRFL